LVIVLEVVQPDETKAKTPIELAIFPMVCFLTSVLATSVLGKLYRKIGRKYTFSIGAFF